MKGLGMRVMWVEVGTARVREISSGEATEELWGRGGEGRGQRQKPRDILMLRGQTKKGDLRKQSGKEPSCYQQSVMMLSAVRHVFSSPWWDSLSGAWASKRFRVGGVITKVLKPGWLWLPQHSLGSLIITIEVRMTLPFSSLYLHQSE